jgi:hypothetical protein
MIVQDEAYLAQARSTEVAARSDWMKAQLSLQRALGSQLEANNIVLENAIREQVQYEFVLRLDLRCMFYTGTSRPSLGPPSP